MGETASKLEAPRSHLPLQEALVVGSANRLLSQAAPNNSMPLASAAPVASIPRKFRCACCKRRFSSHGGAVRHIAFCPVVKEQKRAVLSQLRRENHEMMTTSRDIGTKLKKMLAEIEHRRH